jgi:hypothetical protein
LAYERKMIIRQLPFQHPSSELNALLPVITSTARSCRHLSRSWDAFRKRGVAVVANGLGNDFFEARVPLHLGITEAGALRSGTVKSSIGLGILLWSGIGDTIRVSLSADPVEQA